MKICSQCRLERDESEFRPRRGQCAMCQRLFSAEYDKAHREARREAARMIRSRKKPHEVAWRKANPLKYRLQLYRNGASKRGLEWKLTDIQAAWLLMEPCFYCGTTQSPTGGIDRMDPSRPYEWSNSVPACSRCNLSKQSMTAEQFVISSAMIASPFLGGEVSISRQQ